MTEPVTILSSHLLNVIFNSAQLCEYAVAQILDYSSREDADKRASKTAPLGKGMEKKKRELFFKLKLLMNVQRCLIPKKPRGPTVAGKRAFLSAFVRSFF